MERENTIPRKVEINFSMQNMLDRSTLWSMAIPIEFYARLAKDSGYDGLEYLPLRILPDLQIHTGLITKNALSTIASAHQSYRSEKSFKEVRQHPSPKLAMQAFLFLPERNYSLRHLKKLQKLTGRNIPLVIYPHHEWQGEKPHPLLPSLNNKLIQPAPELLRRWGVDNPIQLTGEIQKRGYDGICLDLFHIRRFATQGFGTQFGEWQEIIPALLPYTKEVHLGVGRVDFKGEFDSMRELVDLYTGSRNTEIISMLETIRDSNWKGPIVTEIPSTGIKEILSVERSIITPKELIAGHKRVVQNIKEILSA